MKRIAIIGVLMLAIFSACQKKAFKHVVIKGRLLYDSTMAPFRDTVYIMADDALSAKNSQEATTFIGEMVCNADGTFSIRSRAAKRPYYYLYVRTKNRSYNVRPKGGRSFTAPDGKTTDLGTILLAN